jgi:N-succinyldiaminopimelate aminotransferase
LFAFTPGGGVWRDVDGLVVSPNPFYQIYEGSPCWPQPFYLPCLEEHGFNPDFDGNSDDIWQRCQILFPLWQPNWRADSSADTLQTDYLTDTRLQTLPMNKPLATVFRQLNPPVERAPLARSWADIISSVAWCSTSPSAVPGHWPASFLQEAGTSDILKSFLLYRTKLTAAPCRYKPSWPA